MSALADLLGLVTLVAYLCSALFWGIAGWLLCSWARMPHRAYLVLASAVLPILGFIGVGVAVTIVLSRRRDAVPSPGSASEPVTLWQQPASQRVVADQGWAPAAAAPQPTVEATSWAEPVRPATPAASGWAEPSAGGSAGSDWTGADSGPTPVGAGRWLSGPAGFAAVVGLVLFALALGASSLLTWFTFSAAGVPPIRLQAGGTGVDVVITASVVLLVVAALATLRRPSRWSAAIVAWISCWWLLLTWAALIAQGPVIEVITGLSSFRVSVGDLVRTVSGGSDVGDAILDVAVGGSDLDDVSAVDLSAVLGDTRFEFGPAVMIMLALAVVGILWSVWMGVLAQRRDHRAAA